MKKIILSVAVLSASIIVIPAIFAFFSGNTTKNSVSAKETNVSDIVLNEYIFDEINVSEAYKVLDITSGQVLEVPVRDYVIGAVCAEMPAVFEEEALKAQAVAAHTYAERQHLLENDNPTPELSGADFSNDTSKYQGYFTESQIKHYFGENYEEYYNKISNAVDEVLPYIITNNEQPIIAAFHSMSSGITESAENVWGAEVDYLVPVDSSYDKSAPRYTEEVSIDKAFLKNSLETYFSDINLGDDINEWIIPAEISDSGMVLTALVGGKTVTGNDIRTALELRSADFEIEYTDEKAIITTRGFGHGVGMSQYGANAMAEKGSSWQEILNHYYTNCEIKKIS
ncbi:MAG: stage II sporulation protein D [Ruminococcus sp.]|nr:stage II sporulation protein D [Ruminococcus sp.]